MSDGQRCACRQQAKFVNNERGDKYESSNTRGDADAWATILQEGAATVGLETTLASRPDTHTHSATLTRKHKH